MNKRKLLRLIKIQQQKLAKIKTPDYFYILASGMIVGGLVIKAATSTSELISPLFDRSVEPQVYAQAVATPTPTPVIDLRVTKLKTFLEKQNSPLAPHAAFIVEQADKYDIGWTRIVAISNMESNYGINCPANSHNAWGIGKPFEYYATWEEGIARASKLLGEHYTWNANQGIKAKYCPASDNCNPQWAYEVTETTQEILAMKGGE